MKDNETETSNHLWPSIKDLIIDLVAMIEWRSGKADQFPEDKRNDDAVTIGADLIAGLARIENSGLINSYRLMIAEFGDDADYHHEEANAYRKRIGFDAFPSSAEEYVGDLLKLGTFWLKVAA